ncbi:MAG TPA: PAS domain S-box protein [Caldimonas sp.]|nr:PAS domain S-box protein [Caldimonas sp.]HEX2540413.1 PAS domain S-box protein [Caldimonas sp.]
MKNSESLGGGTEPQETAGKGHDEPRIEPSPDHAEEALASVMDDVVPARSYEMLPMVGLGGSAGAVPSLQAFFAAMPPRTGMAFVVVLHIGADHGSALTDILRRATKMPVVQVDDTAKVEPDHVYVIAPGKTIQAMDGHLTCTDLTPARGRRVAVDLFFRTLADTHGPRASAVVLSGTDGDGAIGLKRVKERGGLTVAQDPDEAEFDGMPRSAIATGMVDWVLRLADMPARLTRYHGILPRLQLPPEDGVLHPGVPPPAGDDLEASLREILTYVRGQTGRDFMAYKRATILRRLARRMGVNGIEALPDYLAFMRIHPGEAAALVDDLLISVTNFFRDRDAFDALEAQIPSLFANKGPDNAVRVWVAGCATGEEAYSIAMLLCEHARRLEAPPPLQIFATDLAEEAIRVGREGVYPPTITADVSDERLRRFFIRDPRGFRVRSDVRELVLFAVHDLLRDPPFSRIDLVSCRNLLIYLNRDAQARGFDTLHYALRHGGRMFLGSAETTDVREDLFEPVDRKHRIYEPRLVGRSPLPRVAADASALARALQAQEAGRTAIVWPGGLSLAQRHPPAWERASLSDTGMTSWRELHLRLIERLGPPSMIVSDSHAILHLSETAGRFLRFAGGAPTIEVLSAVLPELSIPLRTALVHARDAQGPVEAPATAVTIDGTPAEVVMRVSRADDLARGFLLVTFDVRAVDAAAAGQGDGPVAPGSRERELEQQVEQLKWHLRDVAERGETTTQELKANNEELQAMNEELRSATEELETSREELQSINEELTTVNQELKSNVDELARANADLQNLMGATAIATVFLDRHLRITLYTPSAAPIFGLLPSDVGRPLSDLAPRIDYAQIGDDARRVLERLLPVEREVRAANGVFLARGLPYRSGEDRIAGVVFTFLDITARKAAEEALRESEAQLRTIVNQAAAGVIHLDLDGRLTLVNQRFCEIAGYPQAALIGTRIFDLVHPDDQTANREAFQRLVEHGTAFDMEKRYVRRDGSIVVVSTAATAIVGDDGRPAAVTAIVLNVTDRKRAETALRESEERLRLVVENAREYAIVSMDLQRKVTSWNQGAERIVGYTEQEMLGRSADIVFVDEDRKAGMPEREASVAISEGRAADERWHLRKDGSRFWGSGVMMAMREGGGPAVVGLLKIFRDQTGARAAQEALEISRAELVQALVDNRRARAEAEAASHAKDRFLAILSHELRTPLTPIVLALHALDRSPDLPAAAHGTLELIRRNVTAELHLIDDLLDVTRISSGKLEMVSERTDMHEVVRAAADVCDADFASKRQRLELRLAGVKSHVRGDAQRLRQVVWNLLKNASKFTPAGGSIRVETSNAGGQFVLAVTDTGIGIEPQSVPLIFDAFAQEGEWVTSEFGGLGLGLAIAKATVEAHHGKLSASSAGRNQGATFTIELPLE